MEWEVITTEEFNRWYHDDLTDEQAGAVGARVDMLAATGPTLSRPVVGAIETSRHNNMKELRCSKDGQLRVLFAFDPLRRAILLIGGDKSEGAKEGRASLEETEQAYTSARYGPPVNTP